jgi:ketosteroid isomerase-like protein
MRDIETVAEELRDALGRGERAEREFLRKRYASKVTTTHNPLQPSDGLRDKDELMGHYARQDAATDRLFPEGRQVLRFEVEVVDDSQLLVSTTKRGILADGSALETSSASTYTVENGEIVRLDSGELDARESLAFLRAMVSAGFEYAHAEEAERRLLDRIAAEDTTT